MGSLRDIHRQGIQDRKPPLSELQRFLGPRLYSEMKVFSRIDQTFGDLVKDMSSDCFIAGPPGSGKTILSLLSTLYLTNELVSLPNPWEHYNLNPSHNFNILFLSDHESGIFHRHPFLELMEKIVTSIPSLSKANPQKGVDGYEFLRGGVRARFGGIESLASRTLGYTTFALIVDSERLNSKIVRSNKAMNPKEWLPEPWRININNSRNRGQHTLTMMTLGTTIKTSLKILRHEA